MKVASAKRKRNAVLRMGFMIAFLLVITFLWRMPTQAAPLNLTFLDFPDIFSGFIDVTYDAGTDAFVASGFALEFDDDGSVPPEPILDFGGNLGTVGTFDITATINNFGVLQPGGILLIGGTIPTLGFNSGLLLAGNLTNFGFPNGGGNPLEFQFDVTGGDLAPIYDQPGYFPGVILSSTGFQGTFMADFDNLFAGIPGSGSGVADTAVPEPATLLLLGSGLILLTGFRKKFKR
jgi:hypothetical protein